jgi:hypothetical protein
MRWFLTSPGAAPAQVPRAPGSLREKTDSIRAALIEPLRGVSTTDARILIQRIEYAGDAQQLWYLRTEAMGVLASLRGEAHARETLTRISELFQDVLPDGLACSCASPARPLARQRRGESTT